MPRKKKTADISEVKETKKTKTSIFGKEKEEPKKEIIETPIEVVEEPKEVSEVVKTIIEEPVEKAVEKPIIKRFKKEPQFMNIKYAGGFQYGYKDILFKKEEITEVKTEDAKYLLSLTNKVKRSNGNVYSEPLFIRI